MTRKYGINVLSLWPWSVGRDGAFRAVTMALDAGFDGVQALPLRGCRYEMFEDFVISYEDSFANGGLVESASNSLRKVLRRVFRTGGTSTLSPLLEDWLFFGKDNKTLLAIPGALKVVHRVESPGAVLEINPDAGTFGITYKEYAETHGERSLCWDSRHSRGENRRAGQAVMEPWVALLKSLPKNSIGLIHVNTVQNDRINEPACLLHGWRCGLTVMLEDLQRVTDAPAILEIIPPVISKPLGLWTAKKTVKYLSSVREAVVSILG